MDKLERLLDLTAALLSSPRPLSAEELRQRMPANAYSPEKAAFRRTFERDKADLRAIGMPIRTAMLYRLDPPVEGYEIRSSDYAGRDLRFSPDELAALHLAANLVRLEGGAGRGLARLGAAAGSDAHTGSDAGATVAVGELPFHESVATLMGAAAARRAVSFAYRGSRREVEPWRLSFYRGHWYLVGRDQLQSEARLFRVDRIEDAVEVLGASFTTVGAGPDPRTTRPWEFGDGEPVEVKLLVDADQASWACHRAGVTAEPRPDGAVVLDLRVRDVNALRYFALDFLDHAEILEPQWLRDEFVDWLKALL